MQIFRKKIVSRSLILSHFVGYFIINALLSLVTGLKVGVLSSGLDWASNANLWVFIFVKIALFALYYATVEILIRIASTFCGDFLGTKSAWWLREAAVVASVPFVFVMSFLCFANPHFSMLVNFRPFQSPVGRIDDALFRSASFALSLQFAALCLRLGKHKAVALPPKAVALPIISMICYLFSVFVCYDENWFSGPWLTDSLDPINNSCPGCYAKYDLQVNSSSVDVVQGCFVPKDVPGVPGDHLGYKMIMRYKVIKSSYSNFRLLPHDSTDGFHKDSLGTFMVEREAVATGTTGTIHLYLRRRSGSGPFSGRTEIETIDVLLPTERNPQRCSHP